MVREDKVTMSATELRRVHVIRQVLDKRLTQVKAGALLELTPRQVRRLVRRMEQEGDQGVVHRGRGQPSNRRIPEKRKAKALRLYERQYGDFGPTLAAEKLAERDGITLRCEAGCGRRGSIISRAGSGHIGRGGSDEHMWGN